MKFYQIIGILALMLIGVNAMAAELEVTGALLKPVLTMILGYLPDVVTTVLIAIGGSRVFIKPIMALGEAYTDFTPSTTDNEAWVGFKGGNVFKSLRFLLDYLFSIKLAKK